MTYVPVGIKETKKKKIIAFQKSFDNNSIAIGKFDVKNADSLNNIIFSLNWNAIFYKLDLCQIFKNIVKCDGTFYSA